MVKLLKKFLKKMYFVTLLLGVSLQTFKRALPKALYFFSVYI